MSQNHINAYRTQLTDEQIEAGAHRQFVGGLWEEIGTLQFRYLEAAGLQASDRLLDVGCGSLRGGLHFLRFLDPGNYHGFDINQSLIQAGKKELAAAGLEDRDAQFLVNDQFDFAPFGQAFDCAIAVSLFTHLPMNNIIRCLARVHDVLKDGAKFHATYFEAPSSAHLAPLAHDPGGIVSHYDQDPYHYSIEEMRFMAGLARLRVDLVGAWDHPRDQRMLCFSRE